MKSPLIDGKQETRNQRKNEVKIFTFRLFFIHKVFFNFSHFWCSFYHFLFPGSGPGICDYAFPGNRVLITLELSIVLAHFKKRLQSLGRAQKIYKRSNRLSIASKIQGIHLLFCQHTQQLYQI